MAPRKNNGAAPQRPGEFELIARHFAPLAASGAFGLRDDAALLDAPGASGLVMTQDALAAGVHFFPDDPPGLVARKALRVNLSDLAAKGAKPRWFSLALGLAAGWSEDWVAEFAAGLAQDMRQYGVELTGGDTFSSPERMVVSIAAIGAIPRAAYRSRLAARPGDTLFVTGTLGDAALGLLVRRGEPAFAGLPGADRLRQSYLLPDPPVRFAPLIAGFAAASMDISDGFAGDLAKLAAASGVDFDVPVTAIPFSSAVREALAVEGALEIALTGGDDYQFLFTVPERRLEAFREAAAATDTPVSQLAVARAGEGRIRVIGEQGEELVFAKSSYAHF
jgi:thiamine-monophosphate kinase